MKIFLTLLSGIIAGLSFPTMIQGVALPNLAPLAFVAWVPLFWALRGETPKGCLFYGTASQTVFFATSLFWVNIALYSYGNMPLFLSLILSLGLWVILGFYLGSIFWLSQKLAQAIHVSVSLVRPLVWVGVEFLRNYFPFGGFPWNQLGYTQAGWLHLVQIGDVVGVYGITFLIVLVNEAVFQFCLWVRGKKTATAKWVMVSALAALAFTLGYGHFRLKQLSHEKALSILQVGTVQPNIPQDEKWVEEKADEVLEILKNLTGVLEKKDVQLILWPEAASPYILAYDMEVLPFELPIVRAELLLSAVTLSIHDYAVGKFDRNFNSVLLVNRDGKTLDYYHKNHLVPFGEYIPLKSIFFFADKLAGEGEDLSPGDTLKSINYQGWLLGTLICFEDLFPELSRKLVASGAHVLINTTNDAWYQYSSAAFQHLAFSKMRAVETRRDVLRSTNTGVSAHIDFTGKILWQSKLYETNVYTTALPMRSGKTLYVQWGDVLPWACIILLFCGLGAPYVQRIFSALK